jgi:hypothetical protein
MLAQLRPMSIGDILDTAFRLYRNHLGTYLVIAVIVYVPYSMAIALIEVVTEAMAPATASGKNVVIYAAAETLFAAFAAQPAPPAVPDLSPWLALVTVLAAAASFLLFMVLVYPLCTAALVINVSSSYLGHELSAVESYRRAFGRVVTLIGAQILVGVVILVGFVMCVVPGVLFSLWYMLVPVVVMLEHTDMTQSLARSKALMAQNLGKGFLLGLAVSLLGMLITLAATEVFQLIPWPHPAIATFLSTLAGAVPLPLSIGVVVLFYYDLRIRKEAFDIQHLAASLGEAPRQAHVAY